MEITPVTLIPTLSVRNGNAAIEFYKNAFGAMEIFVERDPLGAVVAQLAIDGVSFLVADESPEHGNYSPETLGGTTIRMGLQVMDPDTSMARAIAAGATEIYPVADQSYGYRLGRIADPYGHHWEIFRPMK
ncbi:VOC family protein [Mucilaginibacter agri]|uniref:VOC family protein n=1 Tax=Mucilaginibacter agri TaxID=2695265 RepID=A0A966DXD7_9SPHI|nr:VOC family protein [Mucilaginibacter agri]NCD72189.1 VOC family protein [Mucilaginibacter agri]